MQFLMFGPFTRLQYFPAKVNAEPWLLSNLDGAVGITNFLQRLPLLLPSVKLYVPVLQDVNADDAGVEFWKFGDLFQDHGCADKVRRYTQHNGVPESHSHQQSHRHGHNHEHIAIPMPKMMASTQIFLGV